MERAPVEFVNLADGLCGRLGGGLLDQRINAGCLELDDLRIDRRIGEFVGSFSNDLRGLGAEAGAQAFDVIFPEIVVLIEHADLGVRTYLQDIFGNDSAFCFKIRIERYRPWERFRIVEATPSRGDEQLRYLL